MKLGHDPLFNFTLITHVQCGEETPQAAQNKCEDISNSRTLINYEHFGKVNGLAVELTLKQVINPVN